MADVRKLTRDIVRQLKEFTEKSQEAKDVLGEFITSLDRMEAGKFTTDMAGIVTVVDQLAVSLRELGFSEGTLNTIRTSLMKFAAEYGRLGDVYGRVGRMPDPMDVPVGPGLLSRLGAMRAVRRLQVVGAGRERAAEMARVAETIPAGDITLAGGNIERIIALRRQAQGYLDAEISKAHERALLYNEWIEKEKELNRLRAEAVGRMEERGLTAEMRLRRGLVGQEVGRETILGGPEVDFEKQRQSRREILEQYGKFIPGGEIGIANLDKRLASLGVTSANVTGVTRELSNGVTTMSFSMQEADNVFTRGIVRMDRFGNVLQDTSRRFKSFSQTIGINIIKVVQWAAATGIVYGAIRNLSSLLRDMTEIQAKLADVQVALGKSQGDLNVIFEEAARIADLTSSSIIGVVEGYSLAYRATGDYTNEAQRMAATNVLLQDSMVLAQLGSIGQAKALDTLVGALRQTGRELTEGSDLLDKWVAVSRAANVSLDTLATTYAIVGAQAQDLGISFEQLSALAASLAEATGLSATETGNAIRGIIAGFQSTQAEKVLDQFGIETRGANDELRNFWDLLNEIAELIASGALSPAQISEISNAIGGGYRRGGQVQVILRTMARSQQLVTEQVNASGEASDALGIKMGTLQAAIRRLQNAFTGLTRTLGDEGGFIGAAGLIVEILTLFVQVVDRLSSGMGKLTPYILAFGAAMLALQTPQGMQLLGGRGAPAWLAGLAGRAGVGVGPGVGAPTYAGRLAGVTAPGGVQAAPYQYTIAGAAGGLRGKAAGAMGGLDPLTALLGIGIVGPSIVEAISATEEERPERVAKAGAQIGGAIIGALLTGGTPVGLVIGAAIAGAFADSIIDYERDIAGRLAETFAEESKKRMEEEEIVPPDITEQIPQGIQFLADLGAIVAQIVEVLPGEQFAFIDRPPGRAVTSEDILINLLRGQIGVDFIVDQIPDEAIEALSDLTAEQMEAGIKKGDIAGAYRRAVEAGIPQMEQAAIPFVEAFMKESQRQFLLGDIGIPDLLRIQTELPAEEIADNLSRIREALTLAGVDIGVDEIIQNFLDLDVAGNNLVDTLSQKVVTAADILAYRIEEYGADSEEAREATEALDRANLSLAKSYEIVIQAAAVAAVEQLGVFDVGLLTRQQAQVGIAMGEALWDAYLWQITQGNEELIKLLKEQAEEVLIRAGEGLETRYLGKTTVPMEFLTQGFAAADLDTSISDMAFGFRDMRDELMQADMPALMARYAQVVTKFADIFPEYEIEETPMGLILKDGFTTIHADMSLFNLAMQDLIDINEQQLEGVWNIPAGMTAMVAITSLYRQQPGGAGAPSWEELWGGVEGVRAEEEVDLQKRVTDITEEIINLQSFLTSLIERGYPGESTIVGIREQIAGLELEKTQLLEQLNIQQLAGKFGVSEPTAALLEHMRQTFTVQNKIELNANIRLVCDGRTLANVVKQYLFEDLVSESNRTGGGGGSSGNIVAY